MSGFIIQNKIMDMLNVNFSVLKGYFDSIQGWKESNNSFSAGNLLVYYRAEFNEWRLKDLSVFSSMDIMTIDFPFDENSKARLWRHCSENYKAD